MRIKFTILTLVFFLLAHTAGAEPAAWEIEGEKGKLVVFGTMHRLPEGTEWLSDPLEGALKNSRLLVLEVQKTQASDDYLGYFLRQPGVSTSDKSLKERLAPEDYAELLSRVGPYGYSEADIENFRPWYAVALLGMLGGEEVGLEFEAGAEQTLNGFAQAKGIRVIGLESPAQQARFYSELPKKVELAWLERTLRREGKPGARSESLLAFWLAGDIKGIGDQVLASYREIPELYDVFLKNRNENWADQLTFLLEEGGQVFVAVGAAHMAGPDSVLILLEERGYKVTRIQ